MIAIVIPPFFRFLGSHNNKVGPSTLALADRLLSCGEDCFIINADSIPASEEYADWYSIFHNYGQYERAVAEMEAGHSMRLEPFKDMMRDLLLVKPDALIVACGDPALPTVDLGGIEIVARTIHLLRRQIPEIPIFGFGCSFQMNPAMAAMVDKVINGFGEGASVRVRNDIYGSKPSYEFTTIPITPKVLNNPVAMADQRALLTAVHPTNFDYTMSSLGCSYARCEFCINTSALIESGYVEMSPWAFVRVIQYKIHTFGLKYFYFADMSFFSHSLEWLTSFAALMQGYNIKFSCEARADEITPEKVTLLRSIGLETVKIGVEGASPKLLDLYKKGIRWHHVEAAVDTCDALGVKTVIYLLLGHPNATEKDYADAFPKAVSLDADYYVVNVACPYVGTDLFNLCDREKLKAHGLLKQGVEHGFTHLSKRLLGFWGISEELFEKYLALSGIKKKEDDGVGGVKKFVRRIL